MKRITLQNYRKDKYYPRIVTAVGEALSSSTEISPVDIFQRMGLLTETQIGDWRAGRLPYLEKAIGCNLAKASRILRILQMHAHDLNLGPVVRRYRRGRRSGRQPLRFTKYHDAKLEEAYARHFVVIGKKRRTDKGEHPRPRAGVEPNGSSGRAPSASLRARAAQPCAVRHPETLGNEMNLGGDR